MLNRRAILFAIFLFCTALLTLIFVDDKGVVFVAKLMLLALFAFPAIVVVLQKTIGASRTKELLANLLLLSVTATLMLIVAEVFVRYLFVDIATTGDNTSYFALRWNKTHTISVNSHGFREREITKQKPANVYRIIVIGDSLTYGQGVAEQDRFSNIIERKLNETKIATEIAYEVLNFGKPGAETIDHIGFLEKVIALDPDFILLQWFINDVEGRDKSARPRPYRLIPSDYLSRFFHRNSALHYLIVQMWNGAQSKLGLISTYDQSMNRRFRDPKSDDSRRAERELNEFIRRVKISNISLGMVLFPTLVETGGDIDNYPFGFLLDRVIEVGRKNDIDYVDMRPVLADITPASDLWVNRFDSHPSALVHNKAATAILQTFREQW